MASAAQTIEFVLWCVREGHFDEKSFTRYQSEQFNLPVVRHEFFATPTDHEFWARVKSLHPWSAQCVPLTDWEGCLLIGTVWPGETFKPSLEHCVVLGTPSELRDYYTRFQVKEAVTVTGITTAPDTAAATEKATAPEPPKSAPAFDSTDPFAALSRQLGIVEDEVAETKDEATTGGEPEGLIIPEGLKFNEAELSRITAVTDSSEAAAPEPASESGTVVHNFETGKGEIVERSADNLAIELTHSTASAELSTPELKLEPANGMVIEPAIELSLQPALEIALPVDLEATQPSVQKVVTETAPAAPRPVMPFVPVVTPERPAMVAPPPPPPPAPAAERPLELEKPGEAESPTRPAPEATVVVKADQTQVQKVARRPLFEPSNEPSSAPQDTSATSAVPSSGTQTGTGSQVGSQTAIRRRLEAPPVTSFFMGISNSSPGPAGAKPQMPPRLSRSPGSYLGTAISVSKLQPVHLDQCKSIDEAGAQSLLQISNTFETAMVLLFKDGVLQPWKWSDLFLSVKGEKPDSIDLKEPSIFKVVFRTAKPYHGYVVTSTVNQKFFNEFNRGVLPKHATVIPVMIDGRMGGMILGLTNSKIEYRQSLRLMERLSFDLARVFKTLRGTMSKAG